MEKNKGGRPSKYDSINHDVVEFMYNNGATDKQVADCLKITDRTLNNWKKDNLKFFQSLKDWKHDADDKVERSLYQRACGYTAKDTKVFFDAKTLTTHTIVIDKVYPPDPTSMIFWLKNRQPQRWKDKREMSFDTGKEKDTKLIIKISK